jgi:hypothetical protein
MRFFVNKLAHITKQSTISDSYRHLSEDPQGTAFPLTREKV